MSDLAVVLGQLTGRLERLERRHMPGTTAVAGWASSGDVSMSGIGIIDTVIVTLGVTDDPVTIEANVAVYFGFATGWINATGDIYTYADGAAHAAAPSPTQASVAGAWSSFPMTYSWAVPAGGNMDFKTRYNLVQSQIANYGWVRTNVSYRVIT